MILMMNIVALNTITNNKSMGRLGVFGRITFLINMSRQDHVANIKLDQ